MFIWVMYVLFIFIIYNKVIMIKVEYVGIKIEIKY